MRKVQSKRLKTGSLLVLLAAGAALLAFGAARKNADADPQAAQAPAEIPAFRYALVEPKSVTLTTELPGRVSAHLVSEVRPQVSGIITKRLFKEGSDVTVGQQLYQIDPATFEVALNNARAALAKAVANEQSARLLAQRYGKVVRSNAVSKQEYDDALAAHAQAAADVDAAKQAVEAARINLGYTKITALVSGRIGRSLVTPGALATQHQPEPLATIQQLDTVYVDLTHANSESLRLRRAHAMGQMNASGEQAAKAKLRLEDGSMYARLPATAEERRHPREIEGELLFSDVTIEKSTSAVTIRAQFANPDTVLLPGMYVRAVVEEGALDAAILVPQKTVMRDTRGRPYLYVLSRDAADGAAPEKRPAGDVYSIAQRHIEIDRHYNNMWLLSAGLQAGDKVLLEGLQKVHPGMVIRGIEAEADTQPLNPEQSR